MAQTPRIVLVAGGASGIGEATVRAFAATGDTVVFGDIADDRGKALADELAATGVRTLYVHADMTREADVAALVDSATEAFGALDVAVNVVGNTGGGDKPGVRVHRQTLEQWHGTMAQSLTSMFLSMKYELGYMVEHGGGVIVNVASVVGMRAVLGATPAYATAKAGVIHLTRYAAASYADSGIRVNAIAPGLTATANAMKEVPGFAEAAASQHAIPRPTTPEDQAHAILWLASDASGMVTGHTIPVDGGWIVK